jgi:hypothetical protein
MSGTSWVRAAPCRGDLRFTPPEGPQPQAQPNPAEQAQEEQAQAAGPARTAAAGKDTTPRALDEALATELLAICHSCPFRAPCIGLVLPSKSKFSGVCGGRWWIDGVVHAACVSAHPYELTERGWYIRHGTPGGARAHNRRGERACEFCRWAERTAARSRREKNSAEH